MERMPLIFSLVIYFSDDDNAKKVTIICVALFAITGAILSALYGSVLFPQGMAKILVTPILSVIGLVVGALTGFLFYLLMLLIIAVSAIICGSYMGAKSIGYLSKKHK